MGDAPHGPLVFGLDDDSGGGGGGPCVSPIAIAYGAGSVSSSTTTRYLQPAGEYTGNNVADVNIIVSRIQKACTVKRFQLRIRAGNGNGADIQYEVMRLVAGVPTTLPVPMLLVLASTFAGDAEVVGDNALVDGDDLVVEVRKAGTVGSSPSDIQAWLQIENDCSGGAGAACCPPSYLHANMWFAYGYSYLSAVPDALDLDASTCGQDGPFTATIRPSAFSPPGTPPTVLSAGYDPILQIFRVTWDGDGTDGQFVLEIKNACGCCWLFPIEGVSV